MKTTNRGFAIHEFRDQNGENCSLQKSSLATEDCIWLGCDNADPKVLIPGKGWQPVEMPDGYMANTRMHLTQETVSELLPILRRFAETGKISEEVEASMDRTDERKLKFYTKCYDRSHVYISETNQKNCYYICWSLGSEREYSYIRSGPFFRFRLRKKIKKLKNKLWKRLTQPNKEARMIYEEIEKYNSFQEPGK